MKTKTDAEIKRDLNYLIALGFTDTSYVNDEAPSVSYPEKFPNFIVYVTEQGFSITDYEEYKDIVDYENISDLLKMYGL